MDSLIVSVFAALGMCCYFVMIFRQASRFGLTMFSWGAAVWLALKLVAVIVHTSPVTVTQWHSGAKLDPPSIILITVGMALFMSRGGLRWNQQKKL